MEAFGEILGLERKEARPPVSSESRFKTLSALGAVMPKNPLELVLIAKMDTSDFCAISSVPANVSRLRLSSPSLIKIMIFLPDSPFSFSWQAR
jgi:hypothetical protein